MTMNNLPERINEITVAAFGRTVGSLVNNTGHYEFSYLDRATHDVSLRMPRATQVSWKYGEVHPVFLQHLPEGFLRKYISEKLERHAKVNDMYFLALQGDKGIGNLGFSSPEMPIFQPESTSLDEILNWDSKENLFPLLLEKYYLNGVVSGVQPKILVHTNHASFIQSQYIVKSFDPEFDLLPLNEFVCMSIAKQIGLPVPDFSLSKDLKRFVIKRFDILENGERLAVEDFTVLMEKSKYEGSYEHLLKTAEVFAGYNGLINMYLYIVFNCMIGNGDAHLKNFAVCYSANSLEPKLSPLYDVTNTMIYPTIDNKLALKLGGSKEAADKSRLIKLAAPYPQLASNAANVIEMMADKINDYFKGNHEHESLKGLKDSILNSVRRASSDRYNTKPFIESGHKKHL